MRSGLGLAVLAVVIAEELPAWGQGQPAATNQPAAAKPADAKPAENKPADAPAPAPSPALDPAVVLGKAKEAYEQKNYPRAVDKYRQFISNFGARPEVPAARYGLARALAAMPEPDWNAIVEVLTPSAAADFPEKPYALYYLGLGYRGQAIRDVKAAEAGGGDAGARLASAKQKFELAGTQFGAAVAGFSALPKSAATPGRVLPVEVEWTARAKCDQAEVLIRSGHLKEAMAIVEPMSKDADLAKSRFAKLAGFYLGWASFEQKDYVGAGRALSALAPFDDPAIGLRARFILGRTHQIAEEAPEASAHFEAVVSGFEKVRRAATEALRNVEAFRERPDERVMLEELAKSTPDWIHEARYQWAVALQQQGQFGQALERLIVFVQQSPRSPLVNEAVLRQGICRVELGQFADATKTLSGLVEHPALAEQALWYYGKAQARMGDAANPKTFEGAVITLGRAAEKAKGAKDGEAKLRRGQILLEMADAQQLAKQFAAAATTYQTVLLEKASEEISELALAKLAVALGLGGQIAESDKICAEFSKKYPKSMATPVVMFRSAENAFHTKQLEEAATRYSVVVSKYPEFAQINAARKGLGTTFYQMGKFEEAAGALQQVPSGERVGEMAGVSYLLAECIIKTMPAEAEDALSTARLVDAIEQASTLLNAFVNAQENHPEVPGALMKIGAMRQKAAAVLLAMEEKQKNLIGARDAYVKVVQRYPNHPQFAVAVMENAKVAAQTGDFGTAINQLNRFQGEPLKSHNIAPLALIHLGDYLRQQKRASEAVALLSAVRGQYAQALLADPARAPWLPTLNYQLGLALKDSGKFAEARAAFEQLSKTFPNSPEALEAGWRVGQSQREEAAGKLAAAKKALTAAAGKPEQTAGAQGMFDVSAKLVREAADYCAAQAAKAEKSPQTKLRLMHEVALCYRSLAEAEFEIAREKMQREQTAKRQATIGVDLPKGRALALRPVEVLGSAVPAQPSEAIAKEKFTALAAAGADTPFAIEARVELAELLAKRGDLDGAIKLLDEAVKQDGPAEYMDKMRMRLAQLALSRSDAKTARAQYEAIIANDKSPYLHHAKVGLGECLFVEKKFEAAKDVMLVYRTTVEYKRMPEVADRAMLRLGQAWAQMGQWENSRLALDAFNRYHPSSPLMPEAKYSMGLALQNQKQLDGALALYREVAAKAEGQLAARAQLQMGMTLLEMKRFDEALDALLVVPLSFDYPELSASALCEAARALVGMNKPAEAKQVLNRVVKDQPTGNWAEVAKKMMAEIK